MGPLGQGPEALVGRVIAGYRLERVLGVGATGAVYLGVREQDHGETVALKLLMPPMQLSADERAEFQARFRREAQALLHLSHPHIVPLLGFGEDPATGYAYKILPFYGGGTLASRLAAGQLPLAEASRYLAQLAEALDYAHGHGIIHRDIKPANILFDAQGQLYLGDFSIARLFEVGQTSTTTTGRILGTPEYMAPEQALGQHAGPGTDIYSLGVLLYQMVTGRVPFQAATLAQLLLLHIQAVPQPPRRLRPDLPLPAEAAILRALAKDPADRFASAGELARAFALGLAGRWAPGLAPQPAQGAPHGRPFGSDAPSSAARRRRRPLVALVSILLAIAVIVGLGAIGSALSGGGNTASGTTGPTSSVSGTTSTTAPQSRELWAFTTGGPLDFTLDSSPAVANGVVYIGSVDHRVYALDAATGRQLWAFTTGYAVVSSPAVVNGVVYVGSTDHNVYALDAATGRGLWTFHTGESVASSPAVANGVVYVGSSDGNVYALDAATGRRLWAFPTGSWVDSSPKLANGVVYVGCGNYKVYALSADTGRQLWVTPTGGPVDSSPAVANGVVYIGSMDANVHALDAATGRQLWAFPTGGPVTSSPAVVNGVVYVGSGDFKVYALNA